MKKESKFFLMIRFLLALETAEMHAQPGNSHADVFRDAIDKRYGDLCDDEKQLFISVRDKLIESRKAMNNEN